MKFVSIYFELEISSIIVQRSQWNCSEVRSVVCKTYLQFLCCQKSEIDCQSILFIINEEWFATLFKSYARNTSNRYILEPFASFTSFNGRACFLCLLSRFVSQLAFSDILRQFPKQCQGILTIFFVRFVFIKTNVKIPFCWNRVARGKNMTK